MEKSKKTDLTNILLLLAAIFAIFLQIFPPKTPKDRVQSVIYFGIILFYIMFLYSFEKINKKIKEYINQINKNREDIDKIKEEIKIDKRFKEMEKRLYFL